MKTIVPLPFDDLEKQEMKFHEVSEDHFIVDPDTYYLFRDEVFIFEMKLFINGHASGKWKDMELLEGADKVSAWLDNQELIQKYYPKYNKIRSKFYQHNNEIYSFDFIGFLDPPYIISLKKYECVDIVRLLNDASKITIFDLIKFKVAKFSNLWR